MKNKKEIADELNEVFGQLKENMQDSFRYVKQNPNNRKEIINLWKNYIRKLFNEFTSMSEKYNEEGIARTITRMLMFGR